MTLNIHDVIEISPMVTKTLPGGTKVTELAIVTTQHTFYINIFHLQEKTNVQG